MIWYLRVNTMPWSAESCASRIRHVESSLQDLCTGAIDVPWTSFDYVEDGDHFTENSAEAFAVRFVDEVRERVGDEIERRGVLVLADSTIDWDNDSGGKSRRIEELFGDINCVVDAVGGSGFCAKAEDNQHFRGRLSRHLRTMKPVPYVVFVGGWNDARDTRFSFESLTLAITGCVELVNRYRRLER